MHLIYIYVTILIDSGAWGWRHICKQNGDLDRQIYSFFNGKYCSLEICFKLLDHEILK